MTHPTPVVRARFAWLCLTVVLSCAVGRISAQESESNTPAHSWRLSSGTFEALERTTQNATSSSLLPGRATPYYTGAQFELASAHVGVRHSYEFQERSQVRRYQAPGGLAIDSQWLSASLRTLVTKRTTVTATQRITYAPFYAPGAPATTSSTPPAGSAGPASGSAALASLTLASGASLVARVSPRTSAAVDYGFDRTGFSATGSSVVNHRASAALSRAIRRDLALQFRYGHSWSATAVPGDATLAQTDDVDATLTYSPVISRRTAVAFGVTPQLTARRQPSTLTRSAPDPAGGSQIGVGGFSKVDYAVTRTWRTGLEFRRVLYYLPIYNLPILADTVTGQMSGSVHRRLTATLSSSYSRGAPGNASPQSRITSASSAARLEFRPFGLTSVYGEFLQESFAMSDDIPRLPGVVGQSRRSSIRAGVTMDLGSSGRSRTLRSDR